MDAPTMGKTLEVIKTLGPHMNESETRVLALVLNGVIERLLKESEEGDN